MPKPHILVVDDSSALGGVEHALGQRYAATVGPRRHRMGQLCASEPLCRYAADVAQLDG